MLGTNGSEGAMTYTAAQNDLSLQKKKLAQEQFEIRLKKFTHNRAAVFGLAVVTLVIVLAVFAPLIALHDPLAMNTADRLKGISAEHWFGTDNMGRDVFARVLYGARISLTVGFTVGLVSGFLGLVIGLYASTNKLADNILMRVCDGLKAIPSTLLAITMMAVLGADIKNVIISLIVVNIPNMARLARSQALVVKEQTYIEAMRCLDSSQAPAPSWGNILKEGKDVIYTAWWMILFPGVFTALTVLGLNLLGDGVRDLMDPKSN